MPETVFRVIGACRANGSALEEEPLRQEIKSLEALGLTRRQAQAAFWIAQGKTNDDVAVILGMSRHTIPHHVEAILARLHLETRAEIMLWTLETLGWLQWPATRRGGAGPSDQKDEESRRKPGGLYGRTVGNAVYIQISESPHHARKITPISATTTSNLLQLQILCPFWPPNRAVK
jgi:DNA-binding CsgD family transcriptional regulator